MRAVAIAQTIDSESRVPFSISEGDPVIDEPSGRVVEALPVQLVVWYTMNKELHMGSPFAGNAFARCRRAVAR